MLLANSLAYKLKQPVRLPFFDFTTLAARRRFCEEESRLNRCFAPSLYLDVVDVCDSPEGPRFGGGGRVLDVAVRVRRFPDGSLWNKILAAGTLGPSHIDAMAQRLSDFHRDAAVAPTGSAFGSAASHESVTRRLIEGGRGLARRGYITRHGSRRLPVVDASNTLRGILAGRRCDPGPGRRAHRTLSDRSSATPGKGSAARAG